MTKLINLPFTSYPSYAIATKGRHLPFINEARCELLIDNSLKIDNCELIIEATGGCD